MRNRRLLTSVAPVLLVLFTLSPGSAFTGEASGPGGTPAAAAPANRLIDSGSPYLLQHAHNPVQWYPWGPEALEKARRENKPIFLSVGYSTCYWCHVANRTLYSDPQIAALMNEWFVNVKIDREQRPDVDAIYMLATLLMTGHGGWPNNVFLTPDLKPFFGGSYFPPHDDELGQPGFVTVIRHIHENWSNQPETIKVQAESVLARMREAQQAQMADVKPGKPTQWLQAARTKLSGYFDTRHGGFRSQDREPQFPQEPWLSMLIADYRASRDPGVLNMLTVTLDAIALGGLHDHVGGGFHRYTTDRAWSVPHFEKMLYNNAQLLKIYAEAWQLTRKPLYRQVALDTGAYLARRMSVPDGGFYTAEDAEVDGEEGASYLWSAEEIEAALGAAETKRLLQVYTITTLPDQRNVDLLRGAERGVLRVRLPPGSNDLAALAPQRAKLLAARELRPAPARDEKMIVALNGMAIEAFATTGRILGERSYVRLAERAAERVWAVAYDTKARRLSHEIFRSHAQVDAFLDDYALLGAGFMALADAGGNPIWRRRAAQFADDMLRLFARADGSLAITPAEKDLVIPPVENGDNAYPSGASAAVALLLHLAAARGEPRYRTAAERVIANLGGQLNAVPEFWPVLVAATVTVTAPRRKSVQEPRAISQQQETPADTAASAAPALPGTAAHVKVAATARSKPEQDEIIVTVQVEKGYHVNANPASYDYLIPTAVTFDGFTPVRVAYPQPTLFKPAFVREEIKVYEGNIEISAELPKGTLRRNQAINGSVSAQACNDQVCLPPTTLKFTAQAQ